MKCTRGHDLVFEPASRLWIHREFADHLLHIVEVDA